MSTTINFNLFPPNFQSFSSLDRVKQTISIIRQHIINSNTYDSTSKIRFIDDLDYHLYQINEDFIKINECFRSFSRVINELEEWKNKYVFELDVVKRFKEINNG